MLSISTVDVDVAWTTLLRRDILSTARPRVRFIPQKKLEEPRHLRRRGFLSRCLPSHPFFASTDARFMSRRSSDRKCVTLRESRHVFDWRFRGSGSSNGVNYAYTLQTKRLSGRYEVSRRHKEESILTRGLRQCHIHRYLLDSDTTEFMTDTFSVAGLQW